MFENKKGFGLGITDWGSWIVFPLILLIFFFLFNLSFDALEFKIDDTVANTESQIVFLNILKTPVKINEQVISISDLIVLYKLEENKDYKNLLENGLTSILNSTFTDTCTSICINQEFFVSGSGCSYLSFECGLFNVQIPNNINASEKIEVSLYVNNEEFQSII